ncbi:hypothetical protein [Martelella soudanensis]|uniref:hypothetical protein n=1 Tax=unclassified Martelella TaxID=2629616 RepID=UPI0015DF00BF|nr:MULTISPECIES: hypothetical protein [unclassified Martelella]
MQDAERLYCLKSAQRDLIALARGIQAAAEISGYSKSEVGRWHNRSDPTLMPLAAVMRLEAETGQPIMTAALAALVGRELTLADEAAAGGAAIRSLFSARAALAEKEANFTRAYTGAWSDLSFTPAEINQCRDELSDLIRSAQTMQNELAVAAAGGGMRAELSVVGGGNDH